MLNTFHYLIFDRDDAYSTQLNHPHGYHGVGLSLIERVITYEL